MRVLLVYPNIVESPKDFSTGLGIISAILKKKGHEVRLLDSTFGLKDREIVNKIIGFKPEVVGISVASNDFPYAKHIASIIKQHTNVPIVGGGYHATIAPEDILNEACFDIAVIGEGEASFAELIKSMEKGKIDTNIRGIWFKINGEIIRNQFRELNSNLNDLPFPDRGLFNYQKHIDHNRGLATFLTTRGCPFQCTYCINAVLIKMFGFKGYVRYRSVDNIFSEIKEVIRKYDIKEIEFYDDTFTLNKKRMREFCERYPKEVGKPFYVNARVNAVDKETFDMLKKAGCVRVSLGIEAGDPVIRNSVLKRNQSDEEIIRTFRIAREAGLQTYAFNMIGIPYETKESIQKTIELNRKCQPDYIGVSIFNAFKGTELYGLCKKNGWLVKGNSASYFQSSNVKHPNFTLKELKKIRDRFGFEVFKESRPLRAYVDLVDKRLIKVPGYLFIRSKLIKSGVKKLLKND